jgi:hypothetical protein
MAKQCSPLRMWYHNAPIKDTLAVNPVFQKGHADILIPAWPFPRKVRNYHTTVSLRPCILCSKIFLIEVMIILVQGSVQNSNTIYNPRAAANRKNIREGAAYLYRLIHAIGKTIRNFLY